MFKQNASFSVFLLTTSTLENEITAFLETSGIKYSVMQPHNPEK
jgi:hypothetical protein